MSDINRDCPACQKLADQQDCAEMTQQILDTYLLTALLDATQDAIIVSDASGVIIRANRAAAKIFGHEAAGLAGSKVNLLMPQALAERHDGFMQTYMDTGKGRVIGAGRQVEGMRSDGSIFPLHLSIGRADFAGNTYFVGILHDISKRVSAELALARSTRLEAMGQMTSGIIHDFSNLLTVVIGNLELLDAKVADAENADMLQDALEAATLGAELTRQLGSFARRTPIRTEPVDVNEACSATFALIRRTFDPKYDLRLELGEALPPVASDPTQMQSALINLALNARDAMPDGGQIILKSDHVSIDDSYIAQELDVTEGDYVRLSMTDTGTGMGPDTQKRVFDPFFTTKPIGKGTGLGLAMVYGFVRQCAGHVAVYSELGHGTTFALYFPVLPTQSHQPAPVLVSAGPVGKGQTILVVEDDAKVRALTVARIKELGFAVLSAKDGDEAVMLLETTPEIAAVFTDLVMPGALDGLALARHVKATYPQKLILLTSGYAEDILSKTGEKPDHELLRKPYRQKDLAAALVRLFKTPAR